MRFFGLFAIFPGPPLHFFFSLYQHKEKNETKQRKKEKLRNWRRLRSFFPCHTFLLSDNFHAVSFGIPEFFLFFTL
jgi:hypothetical protein